MNKTKCIITSASNKFFPSLLNFLGSIKTNYPNHPDIYVYDLGLFYTFRKELESIPWVHVLDVPHFVPHWRSCYTWKTYILNTPLTELNFYIDAGCQILKSLDTLFDKIDEQGYLAVSQGAHVVIKDITPQEYLNLYQLTENDAQQNVITAGIFGFKKDSPIKKVTEELYQAGLQKLCLGFSQGELWKNKGVNKTDFIRDCKMFRHDTTLITILLRKNIPNATIEPVESFSSIKEKSAEQFIWNFRLNYKKLTFIHYNILHKKINFYTTINRLYTYTFIVIKRITNNIKQKCFHS
jgi:hypothetical protein